ncbi:MAG: hypothetical protein Q4C56_09130 [Peptococcaceae bacterium]|nr:hypothetical protein [Peptococcaceae bacterium]
MRLFLLECKRVLKTRRTPILMLLVLGMTLFAAYMPVHYYTSFTTEGVELTGLDAIRYDKESQADLRGEVTPEKVRHALQTYQTVMRRNVTDMDANVYSLPDKEKGIIDREAGMLLNGLQDIFSTQGQPTDLMDIDPARVADYDAAPLARIQELQHMQYPDNPLPAEYFTRLYEKVDHPFYYAPGADATTLEYQLMLGFMLLMCCALLVAPTFASDYQTGADDIQRCARHGRRRLALVRIGASLVICGVLSASALALYWLISNSLYGWDVRDGSMQLLSIFGLTVPANMTFGELQLAFALVSLLSILSTVCAVLFLSARLNGLIASTASSLGLCILPMIVYLFVPEGAINWVNTLLPSSSLALQASVLYQMREFGVLMLGNFICWVPIAMIVVCAIELPIFAALALVSYNCRRA